MNPLIYEKIMEIINYLLSADKPYIDLNKLMEVLADQGFNVTERELKNVLLKMETLGIVIVKEVKRGVFRIEPGKVMIVQVDEE